MVTTNNPVKHSLFATKNVPEAMQYVDDILKNMNKEDQLTAYTAAYVMYNSVIEHYETNMVCTTKEEK
jgi:hypothetical protein